MITGPRIESIAQGFAVIKIFIFTEFLSMIGSHEDEGIVTNWCLVVEVDGNSHNDNYNYDMKRQTKLKI